MKNIFRVIGFGLAVVAFSAVNGFAQNPCDDTYEVKTAAQQKFNDNKAAPRTVEKLKIALEAGNAFVTRYKGCEDTKAVVDFITETLPAVQKEYERLDRNGRFNKAVPAKNWAEAFTAGKQIIAADPDAPVALDVALVLASIGFDRAAIDKVDTFNNDTVAMAELAINKMQAGITSTNYGAFGTYVYKTKAFPDGKENALGWMNYTIGYVKYIRQKNSKDALPYLFAAATKHNSATKNFPEIYEMMAVHYKDELIKLDKTRQEKITANGNKDNDETLAIWAMERGYIERAIDAYSRSHKIVAANAKTPPQIENKNRIYGEMQALYESSFKKKDGLDPYVATLMSKPLTDPTTAITPIKEEVPVTTTTTTSSTTTTNPTTTTTVKPTSTTTTTTTKPATTTTKPATPTKPNSSTTTPTTKPKTTKKKTTR